MRRVILDTNIYGRILERRERQLFEEALEKRKDIVIYGFDAIRKELRNISKKVVYDKLKIRITLLRLYDKLATQHVYFTTSSVQRLANEYYSVYEKIGGKENKEEMLVDFLIVACASIHELDLVVSDDNNTMLHEDSIKTYRIVNELRNYSTPNFIGYDAFRRLIT